MLENRIKVLIALFVIILPIITIGCAGTDAIIPSQFDDKVQVDGQTDEWKGNMKYYEKANISVGVKNDKSNLYAAIAISDRDMIMKAARLGFTVWIEPKETGKRIGIKYPKPSKPDFSKNGPMDMPGDFQGIRPGEEGFNPEKGMDKMIESSFKNCTDIDILDDDKNVVATVSVNEPGGARVGMKYIERVLNYEIKLPLTKEFLNDYKLDISNEKEYYLIVETNKFEMSEMMPPMGGGEGGMSGGPSGGGPMGGGAQMGGGPGGGGQGGHGGGRPGGPMGGNNNQRSDKEMSFKALVTLP